MATDHVLNVSIVTPQTTAWNGSALAIAVPGSKSPFQVLYNHAPIISALDVGVIKVSESDSTATYYASKEGFVEVIHNTVSLIVNDLQKSTDIDAAVAEADLESARERSESGDRTERLRARKDIAWAEARLRAIRLQREHA